MTTTIDTPADVQQALDKVVELKTEEVKAMSLVERIWRMQAELGRVAKLGTNENQNYKYLRESDLVARVVELSAKYRVLVVFKQLVERTTIDTSLKSARGGTMTGTSVIESYDIINVDKPEEKLSGIMGELFSQGYSADSGDKSLYKAKTGAKKYALTDTFMVSSGDDPEGVGAADGAPQGRGNRGADDGGQATEEQVKLFINRQKTWKIPVPAAIGAIGKAVGQSLNLKPGDVAPFLRTMSHRDMGKALAELQRIKPREDASSASQQPPATNQPPPRVPSAQ